MFSYIKLEDRHPGEKVVISSGTHCNENEGREGEGREGTKPGSNWASLSKLNPPLLSFHAQSELIMLPTTQTCWGDSIRYYSQGVWYRVQNMMERAKHSKPGAHTTPAGRKGLTGKSSQVTL